MHASWLASAQASDALVLRQRVAIARRASFCHDEEASLMNDDAVKFIFITLQCSLGSRYYATFLFASQEIRLSSLRVVELSGQRSPPQEFDPNGELVWPYTLIHIIGAMFYATCIPRRKQEDMEACLSYALTNVHAFSIVSGTSQVTPIL
ncbi:hypothetical protein D9756_004419 [Leucocoprinus leucothites]|uniref:Uncharacterized protein n=1 Tax=Leucocoprinus leucothites TaxID=201217 RepID=A0A8H5D9X8_9AGAR|nr:hypothetical protein D9756_004419 [Leucoagaricus leucothites]